jgi:nucleotide-binding universal stress UspA family protein
VGAAEAQRRNTDLRVVHAYDEIWTEVNYATGHEVMEIVRNQAEGITADAALVAHAVAPDLSVRRDAIPGDPRAVLLGAAESAERAVVGNRGRGGFTSLMLGSVGQRVATHAPCPVVVVRGRAAAVDGPIVVGADGSAAGTHALQLAFDQATAREAL